MAGRRACSGRSSRITPRVFSALASHRAGSRSGARLLNARVLLTGKRSPGDVRPEAPQSFGDPANEIFARYPGEGIRAVWAPTDPAA
jgi:hypothetical protein